MDRLDSLDTLDFYDNGAFDNQIRPVFRYQVAFVVQRQSGLALKHDTLFFEFHDDCAFVHRLQQPRAEVPMHFNSAVDDAMRQRRMRAVVEILNHVPASVPSVPLWFASGEAQERGQ
jgi:hypothetical protein